MCKLKHQYRRAMDTNGCMQISSNIAGYIRNKFKPLAVDNVHTMLHIATVAQLTLTMHMFTTLQLPLHAEGSPDSVRFRNNDGHHRVCGAILI